MSNVSGYQGNFQPGVSAVIASGQTASAAVPLKGLVPVGIYVPAAFTGTALSFQASADGTTFVPVKSGTTGAALSYTVAPGQFNAIDPKDLQGIAFLKIVSGTAEAAARTLLVAMKGF